MDRTWDGVAEGGQGSWYLDPLAARQKREVHLELFRRWMPGDAQRALKTDLFQEANGDDFILPGLADRAARWIGMDIATGTVQRARERKGLEAAGLLACDARAMALRDGCLDAVVSDSTLDHFGTRAEFERALAELARVLRPGGRLLITVDNPCNLLYPPLRWLSRTRLAPFPLGYTPRAAALRASLEAAGLDVVSTAALIHNPRIVSTLLFLMLRRLLGRRADRPVQWLLDAFAKLERLPSRPVTACFIGACAEKPRDVRR